MLNLSYNFHRIKKAHRIQAGFSLLEVLVGAAILAFIAIGVVEFTENTIKTKENVTREDQEDSKIEMAFARISNDIHFIYTPLFFDQKKKKNANGQYREDRNERFSDFSEELGQPIPIFVSETKDSLIFFAGNNMRKIEDQKESQFYWIRYLVKDDTLFRETIAKDINNPSALDWESAKSFPLLKDVKKLVFSYYDTKKKEYEESFRNTEKYPNWMSAVKIELTHEPEGRESQTYKRVFSGIYPTVEDLKKRDEDEKKAIDLIR